MELVGWVSTVAFSVCYWPQLYRSYKLKTVGDISVWTWFMQLLGCLFGLYYGMELRQLPLIIGYLHGTLCNVAFLIMYVGYSD